MSRQIKLIWDFRGSVANEIAKHHQIHLKDFIKAEKCVVNITGYETFNEIHSIAFMVVNEIDMVAIRDALKPNRAEVFEESIN